MISHSDRYTHYTTTHGKVNSCRLGLVAASVVTMARVCALPVAPLAARSSAGVRQPVCGPEADGEWRRRLVRSTLDLCPVCRRCRLSGYTLRQRRDSPSQLCPLIANRLLDELLGSREGWRRHHHLQDTGHVLAVVVAQQGKHPRDQLREAVLRHGACHDTDCLALVGHGHALPHEAVQVCVFLSQVKVEMELECCSGARRPLRRLLCAPRACYADHSRSLRTG